MPVNSRAKGAAFERVICKKINTYLASKGNIIVDEFWGITFKTVKEFFTEFWVKIVIGKKRCCLTSRRFVFVFYTVA